MEDNVIEPPAEFGIFLAERQIDMIRPHLHHASNVDKVMHKTNFVFAMEILSMFDIDDDEFGDDDFEFPDKCIYSIHNYWPIVSTLVTRRNGKINSQPQSHYKCGAMMRTGDDRCGCCWRFLKIACHPFNRLVFLDLCRNFRVP
jgi:hypothetical protein